MYDNKKLDELKDVKIFVGLDMGKEVNFGSLIERSGSILKSGLKIRNDKEGFENLSNLLEISGKREEIAIGLEPTGHYWKPLGYYLKERGYNIYLVNPYHVKLSKELRDNRQSKTDKKDSKLIGHLLREGKYLSSLLLDGDYETLRRTTIIREKVVQERARSLNRLRTTLEEYLPEYEKCFAQITGKTSLGLLKKYGIKELREPLKKDEILKSILEMSRKRIPKNKAELITQKLSETIGIKEGIAGAEIEIRIWIKQIESYNAELIGIEKEIKRLLFQIDEGQYLLSIKGVGVITAGVILGQTGSSKNFKNAKQLEKLAGLDLIEKSSGKKIGTKKISKRGRDLLRYGLYRVTVMCITNNHEIKKLYLNKVENNKKNKMVALTSISVKILRIMFSLVKNKSFYDSRKVS